MPTNTTIRIGDRWAKRISVSFVNWADNTKKHIPTEYTNWKPFDPTSQIRGAFLESATAQANTLANTLNLSAITPIRSSKAEEWIAKYAATEIKAIDEVSKQAIRDIILRGFAEGITPYSQAQAIRPFIGLTPTQTIALQNYMESLGIEDQSLIWQMGEQYGRKLLNFRAETIALTEGHIASNEGWREENEDAVDRGVLDEDEYEQEWLGTDDGRMCEVCADMVGKTAEIGGEFDDGSRGPPLHPRCRCTTIIVKKED